MLLFVRPVVLVPPDRGIGCEQKFGSLIGEERLFGSVFGRIRKARIGPDGALLRITPE